MGHKCWRGVARTFFPMGGGGKLSKQKKNFFINFECPRDNTHLPPLIFWLRPSNDFTNFEANLAGCFRARVVTKIKLEQSFQVSNFGFLFLKIGSHSLIWVTMTHYSHPCLETKTCPDSVGEIFNETYASTAPTINFSPCSLS